MSSSGQKQHTKVTTDIQLYDGGNTLSLDGFREDFCRKLESFECHPIIAIRADNKSIDKNTPLLALCHHEFRVGTDVDMATREIVTDSAINLKSVAVVVVHQKDEFALSKSRSRNALLDEKYEEFGLIVDIAFGSDRTCYNCPMNREGFQSLYDFIKPYSKAEEIPTSDGGKATTKQKWQLYRQPKCDKFYNEMVAYFQGAKKDFHFDELGSVLDRAMSQPMVAILQASSDVYTKFMESTETPSHPTVLIVLQDGGKEATSVQKDLMEIIYFDEERKNRDGEYAQKVLSKIEVALKRAAVKEREQGGLLQFFCHILKKIL